MKANKGRPIINTPIRTRENSHNNAPRAHPLTPTRLNKENSSLGAQTHHLQGLTTAGLSPNKITATRKPNVLGRQLLSHQYHTAQSGQPGQLQPLGDTPGQQPRKASSNRVNLASSGRRECANHPDKEPEFRIIIEGEAMLYCSKCSAHLASQGFPVERLSRLGAARPSLPAGSTAISALLEGSQAPRVDPSLASHPRYQEIAAFLERIGTVGGALRRNGEAFSSLAGHYAEQEELIEEFYDAMGEYLKHVKSQHLGLVRSESRKYVQIGEIECGEIEENLAELEYISSDMQGNLASIVREITEDKYRECFNFYSQKVELYRHRSEEQTASLQDVTRLAKDDLEAKLTEFRSTVNDLFGVRESPSPASNPVAQRFSSHTAAATLKKPQGPQSHRPSSNGPFRNLFEEEESLSEQCLPDQSPQFKNI